MARRAEGGKAEGVVCAMLRTQAEPARSGDGLAWEKVAAGAFSGEKGAAIPQEYRSSRTASACCAGVLIRSLASAARRTKVLKIGDNSAPAAEEGEDNAERGKNVNRSARAIRECLARAERRLSASVRRCLMRTRAWGRRVLVWCTASWRRVRMLLKRICQSSWERDVPDGTVGEMRYGEDKDMR